jgi:hypothetical protein
MMNATLTLNVESVTIADDKVVGTAKFTTGKKLDPINFSGSAKYLKDTLNPGTIAIATGAIRAIKDSTGQTSLSLNISNAIAVTSAIVLEPTTQERLPESVVETPKTAAKKRTNSRKKVAV